MTTPVTTDAEFLVNTYTSSHQQSSSLAGLENGGFIVTWQSEGQDGSGTGIYAQLYDADGAADGSEFLINTTTANDQNAPAVAALADGSFVVTWESDVQDGSDYGVYAQRFNADGTVAGSEFLVNTYTSDGQASPQITALNGGGFVVTWESTLQDGSANGIYAQRYDAAGVAAGSEFLVNTTTTGSQDSPSITALDSGGFLVTWSGSDGSGSGINGQLYTSTGVASGSEFVINATTSGDQYIPSTAGLSGGGFVTVWESDGQDGSGAGIYGQRYTSAGVAAGSEFLVNTTTSGSQRSGKVTALDDGGFVVTWQSADASNIGVYGQLYDSSGAKSGTQFLINTTTTNNQIDANVSALSEGGFVVSWTSALQDGALNGVYAQMYSYADGAFTSSGDTVTLYGPGQSVDGLGGADTITGANYAGGADFISGGKGKDTLYGKKGTDTLKGDKGDDKLYGGKGDDKVKGGKGDDKLWGGKGDDKMTGNAGKDVFVFKKQEGTDTITDFQNSKDKIDLSAFNFASKSAALAKFYEIGSASNDKLGFDFKGTEITVKGIDMGDLNGADLII